QVQAGRRWSLATGERASRPVGRRAGCVRRSAEPMEHATCLTRVSVVCSRFGGEPAMMLSLDWSQALAWRMRQQLLDPIGTESAAGVVHHLGAMPAQPDAAADLAVRTRCARSRSGEVARALAEGQIIMTYAFRGATHLMTPEDAGVYLALRAASRMW